MQESDFLYAPYVHQHNEPKYHALLLGAAEYAKRHKTYCLWFRAHDTTMDRMERPMDPMKLQKKKERLLQKHDQQTNGIPGLFLLSDRLKLRVAEKIWISKEIIIFKDTSCEVVGWRLNSLDCVGSEDSSNPRERFLDYFLEVIFVRFDDVSWKLKGLPVGVLPMRLDSKT